MKPKPAKAFYHSAQNLTEQLVSLFQARAAAVWLVDSQPTALFLAESHVSGTPKASPFRRLLTHKPQASVPNQPTFIKESGTTKLDAYLVKATNITNALRLPLLKSNRLVGEALVLDLDHWDNHLQHLAIYIADQVGQQWSLSQQLEQQSRQLEEMSDQTRQWQAIYMGVQESIVLLNAKGKILILNPATERITGHKAQEMIGRHIGELFPKVGPLGSGIDYPGRSGLYETLEEKRPSDLFEAVVETKDKRHIWINYTYNPLWDGNGQMIGLVRVTSDVSTIKTVEQMKNDFVSMASHELRTPLGVISGYLNLFLAGQLGPLTQDQQTFLERIYHSSADMSALVEDLLNISRIEAGRLEVSVQPFVIGQLVAEVINHLELKAQTKAIQIHIKHSNQPIKIKADRQKVEQALTNIIDNAIKYTYEHGQITISIRAIDGAVEIVVKDSGVGINPEHIGHVFEKFFRGSNPLSVKEGGSGLGLYISRKLIELHGGTIKVTSKPEHGSIFTIKLPIAAKKHSLT
jgi:PAS domain S-box-containing protein